MSITWVPFSSKDSSKGEFPASRRGGEGRREGEEEGGGEGKKERKTPCRKMMSIAMFFVIVKNFTIYIDIDTETPTSNTTTGVINSGAALL